MADRTIDRYVRLTIFSGVALTAVGCASSADRAGRPVTAREVVPTAVQPASSSLEAASKLLGRNAPRTGQRPTSDERMDAEGELTQSSHTELVFPHDDAQNAPLPDEIGNTPDEDVRASGPLLIDLATALETIAGQNPRIGFAQERIEEAAAQLESAGVLWVPSIRAGVNYNKHEGRIQDVAGNIIETSRGSVYTGLGAQAVGAGSPAVPGLLMNFHLKDAIFLPQIAHQAYRSREFASQAVVNDVLLETAVAYINLLEALQIKAVADETLANAQRLAELTQSFAETGQGLLADADRAKAELSVRQIEVQRAGENVRVAAVRLTRLLSEDQSHELVPLESALAPIELVSIETDVNDLISIGLTNRPELNEAQALVREAIQRYRREKYSPLVPSVLLGLSYGGNGGGLGSNVNLFGDRLDFDAAAYWEIRNFGYGEQAARNQTQSQVEQARWRQVQTMDQVAADVGEAHAQVSARKSQIEMAQNGIVAAQDSYRRNVERINDAQGLPIETLQSIQALDQARRQYVRAVADYNRAQFQLHRALGWPIQ